MSTPVDDELSRRRQLSFAQAEGVAPLPSQMNRDAITQTLRARLWALMNDMLRQMRYGSGGYLRLEFQPIFADCHVRHFGKYIDEFQADDQYILRTQAGIIKTGTYTSIYGFLQFLIRHRAIPHALAPAINQILEEERAAFRIVGGDTFMPVATSEEVNAVENALGDTQNDTFAGAHKHLRNAAECLTAGSFADSVRESIHAVEAVARTLEPSAELSKALAKLESSANIHGAMKRGFAAIYGYTSDQGGIRHPLLESGDAAVDEADALFMIGACSSFVSYLIAKKAAAGIGP